MRAQSTQPVDRTDDIETLVRALLRDVLSLSQERADAFEADTPLFGALPELDSMAVVSLIAALESHFGLIVDDDDIDGSTFATVGSLVDFVNDKLAA